MRLALLLKLIKTFRLSTNMSSSVCIAREAMAAYQSFIQIMLKHYQGQPSVEAFVQQRDADRQADLAATILWMHKYMAAHPEAWWEVEDAQIVDVVSALPLTHEAMEEVIELARYLKDPRRNNTLTSIPEEEVHDAQRAKPPSNTNI